MVGRAEDVARHGRDGLGLEQVRAEPGRPSIVEVARQVGEGVEGTPRLGQGEAEVLANATTIFWFIWLRMSQILTCPSPPPLTIRREFDVTATAVTPYLHVHVL